MSAERSWTQEARETLVACLAMLTDRMEAQDWEGVKGAKVGVECALGVVAGAERVDRGGGAGAGGGAGGAGSAGG